MKNVVAKTFKMPNSASIWIKRLGLEPHPEGGHFKEVYRSGETIEKACLPGDFNSDRSISTSIYFLLSRDERSAFHRIKSDETWYFHDGDELEIFVIDNNGGLTKRVLGINPENDSLPQITIEKGSWFAARTTNEFTLVSCNVSPGFDFEDFELAAYDTLIKKYPQYNQILKEFCLQS